MPAYVYILSNTTRTTLYIGSTSDLCETLMLYCHDTLPITTPEQRLHHLIYLETAPDMGMAQARQRQLESARKIQNWNLIFSCNPLLREMNGSNGELIIESAAFQKAC